MTTESLGWLGPAPVWGEGGVGVESNELLQPFLTELTSDQFVTEFLGVLAGSSPADLATMAPKTTSDGTDTGPYRLYQPLSQRYYLVTASLVCRRVGIPDRAVRRSKGERTTFVLRRVTADGSEQAWVPAPAAVPGDPPGGSWNTTVPGRLTAGEEQLPMHAAPVAGFAQPGTTAAAFGMSEPGRRTVHYGYIPTGRRERLVTALTNDQAVQALQSVDPTGKEDPILSALWTRVILPLGVLRGALPPSPPPPGPPPPGTNTDYSSLYVLLDLSDWLNTYLPSVHDALIGNTTLPSHTPAEDLRAALADVLIHTTQPGSTADVPLHQVLSDLAPFHTLVTGADTAGPATSYDLVHSAIPAVWFADPDIGPATPSVPASLAYLARAALDEYQVQPVVPDELTGMIKLDPALPPPGYTPDTYIIRTVFEHDPCLPVLSAPSRTFQLARALDGDAPARKIRIALPDISNLRQFNRGVAIEMPPSLRRVLDRVTPAMLQGKGLGSDPGVELGMICSFSIQIMWVLSFMVMFLFVIAFNIIFWWIPFIKICFPIPAPASQPKNPSP